MYVLSLIFGFAVPYMECFSQRSDRLHYNRNSVKLVASKFLEEIPNSGLAFD